MASSETAACPCSRPCSCPDRVCKVAPGEGVERAGKAFCCEACAAGHPDRSGRGRSGCARHG